MDTQTIVNFAIGAAGFFGAFILNGISNKIQRLDDDVRKIERNTVTREEARHDMDEIKDMFQRIWTRLEQKADKN
jgi:hypothetical protein